MEACWPSGVVLRGKASNHPVLRWLKTVVVSDREKARLIASGGDQEDVPESSGRGSCSGRASSFEASKPVETTSKPRSGFVLGMSLAGVPITGQAVPGVKAA